MLKAITGRWVDLLSPFLRRNVTANDLSRHNKLLMDRDRERESEEFNQFAPQVDFLSDLVAFQFVVENTITIACGRAEEEEVG